MQAPKNLKNLSSKQKKQKAGPKALGHEHSSARRLVFEKIVAETIEDPKHPYYSLVPKKIRREMIEEITSQLIDSHYLNQVDATEESKNLED